MSPDPVEGRSGKRARAMGKLENGHVVAERAEIREVA